MAINPLTPRVNNIETGGTWKIGDVKHSFLTEAEFQAEHDSTWGLCDGRDVTGSDYAILKTGDNITPHNIPDARGQFLRGKDHGRHAIDGNGNPDGDLDLGFYTGDKFQGHNHNVIDGDVANTTTAGSNPIGMVGDEATSGIGGDFKYDLRFRNGGVADRGVSSSSGSNETAPKNLTCNMFIKINREPSA